MQTFLNQIIYFAVAAYGICFLYKVYEGFTQITVPCLDAKLETSKASKENLEEITILSNQVKENSYSYVVKPKTPVNPALKPYNKVTIAEMKAFIKEQQIEAEVGQLMHKKLYKARKNDYYQALKAI